MWAPNVPACYIGREFSSYNSETNSSCLYLVDLFVSGKKSVVSCEKFNLLIPICELSTLHPNCRSLRLVRCLTSITSENSRNPHTLLTKLNSSSPGRSKKEIITKQEKIVYFVTNQQIHSVEPFTDSSWAHSPGPSCSFTSASSFW